MPLRIRITASSGSSLQYSVERNEDGLYYDFSTSLFASSPVQLFATLPEATPNFPGQFNATLSPTPQSQFSDGDYTISIKDTLAGAITLTAPVVMFGGDDKTQPPNSATVTGPVTVGGFSDGVSVPLPSGASAILYGTITNVSDVLTWHDPGTTTPRVRLTPDGSDGYTSELL